MSLRKAVLKSFDSGDYTATIQLGGSYKAYLEDIAVARNLPAAEMESVSGTIRIPVNCGQQLYDVIDITDDRAGLEAEKKRVLGLNLAYNPRRGQYEQQLLLGAV